MAPKHLKCRPRVTRRGAGNEGEENAQLRQLYRQILTLKKNEKEFWESPSSRPVTSWIIIYFMRKRDIF